MADTVESSEVVTDNLIPGYLGKILREIKSKSQDSVPVDLLLDTVQIEIMTSNKFEIVNGMKYGFDITLNDNHNSPNNQMWVNLQ